MCAECQQQGGNQFNGARNEQGEKDAGAIHLGQQDEKTAKTDSGQAGQPTL